MDAPTIMEGSGKKIYKLHCMVRQILRALKSMGYDPLGPFITSVLELKLDPTTMFEWQKHSQKSTDVPYYQELLELFNLRAQRIQSLLSKVNKKTRHDSHCIRKVFFAQW